MSRLLPAANDLTWLSSYNIILEYINITDAVKLALYNAVSKIIQFYVQSHTLIDTALLHAYLANGSSLVSLHFMRGRELSTLVVILSVIMGIHFKVIKLEHRMLYSHYSFSIDGKSLFLSYFCIQRSTQGIESQES